MVGKNSMKAYTKDIVRSIIKGRKRFFALMMITALGVCMLTGLKAACEDLRYSADAFFDKQNLYDISIVSTMGLTEEDVEVIADLEGVEEAEGVYSETVYTQLDGVTKQAAVQVLGEKGINVPYLLEGKMPKKEADILVTEKYLKESGKSIGDMVYIEEESGSEEDEKNFQFTAFRICGVVIDITNINSTEGAVAFRDNSATDYTFFVSKEAVTYDIYTAMYLTLEDTDELVCYSEEYEAKVDEIVTLLEDEIKEDREQARYDKIVGDALEEVAEAEEEMWEEFEKAEQEISDAEAEIADGWKELEDGEKELTKAERELPKAERELLKAERELERGEEELAAAEAELAEGETQIALLEMLIQESESKLEIWEGILKKYNREQGEFYKKIEAGRAEIQNYKAQLAESRAQLEAGKAQIASAKAELAYGWAEVEKGWKELESGEKKIYDGLDEIEEGKAELAEGEVTLAENLAEYEEKKAEALEEIAEAKQEIADLKMTAWYITTRTSLSGYGNVKTDASCIESIGNAFPVIFLTIAILISLTTMTRMVEEDRGLIGTYKALGFTDAEIRRKYVIYAFLACLIGGILGDLLGFILLPEIIFTIFGVMYQLPEYSLSFNYLYGIGGIILFIVGIVGACMASCKAILSNMPATLMRAKAPSLGSRVLLEYVTPVWSQLSFLNKVTARNLFRYKKRLFMTLFGIAGCTALLIAGFAIKDTVTSLMPRQYEETFRYDAMAVAEENEKLLEYLEEESSVRKYLNTLITNIKVMGESGKEETVQLIVVPENESISRYIKLYDEDGEKLTLSEEDVFATINLSKVVGFAEEDFVTLQTLDLQQAEVEVSKIAMNYLGNCVYMTQRQYEDCFGTFEPNAALILLKTEGEEQDEFVEELQGKDGILSVVGTNSLMDGFEPAFKIINMVVYIVIILAAALAFVVLFTLATTNISERERELATIKVLGFYDFEVHSYVNKETLILTALGALMGLPLGKILGEWLLGVLNMPSIYFATRIEPVSYALAAIMSVGFAFLVNLMTDRSLDKINPVEALKSIE